MEITREEEDWWRAFPLPGNLSPAPGNHPFSNLHPYRNTTLPNTVHLNPTFPETLYDNTVSLNPSFHETLYDPFLETEFSHLNISTPSHQSPFVAPSGGGGGAISGGGGSILGNPIPWIDSSYDMGFPPTSQTQYTNMDLHRLRVQSAVRGVPSFLGDENLGRFGMPNLNSHAVTNYPQFDNLYNGGGRNLIRSRLDRNGFQSPHDFVHGNGYNPFPCRARSTINGYESEDSSVLNLMTSLCNNNNTNIYRTRQRLNFASLKDLRGKVFSVAKHQHGCRFLQKKFEEGTPEEIEMIFSEVKDRIGELMVDQFGNYLIQKFFELCNEEQMSQILLSVISDDPGLMTICLDMHGTRAMQKLLEHLTTQEQRSLVVSVLRRITVTLTKSMNGHHVIQHCLKFFSNEDNRHILNVVADNCLDIAMDKSGCCVLQQCVAHAQGEPKERLVAEITANALVLSEHAYGNYVVQYILGMGIADVTADILAQLAGNYVPLSMDKHGSNVVEKCLRESSEDQSFQVIKEIIRSPNFLMVLQDRYGNYVAQSALAISKKELRQEMISLIQNHYPFLHSHPYGKRVLDRTRGSKQRCINM